jgi:hypothetical protein
MFNPIALYELGKSIHEERLREVERFRLSSAARSESADQFNRRRRHINVKDVFTRKSVAKTIRFAHLDYIITLKET